jgi:hypothetical protein
MQAITNFFINIFKSIYLSLIYPVIHRFDEMFMEGNSPTRWSSTKIGTFFVLYPALGYTYILDASKHGMDWMNTIVFTLAVVSPRALNHIVALKQQGMGINGMQKPIKDDDSDNDDEPAKAEDTHKAEPAEDK